MAHEDLHTAAQGVLDAARTTHLTREAMDLALDRLEDAVCRQAPVSAFHDCIPAAELDRALVLARACERLANMRPHGVLEGEHGEWEARRDLLERVRRNLL